MSRSGSSASRKSSCAAIRFAEWSSTVQEDDPVAEQSRVDVERALDAAVRLDDHRHQRAHGAPPARLATFELPILTGNQRVAEGGGMEVTRELVLPADPEEVWDAVT